MRDEIDELMTKAERAFAIFDELLPHRGSRVSIEKIMEAADEAEVSRRTMRRIKLDLGVKEVYNGPHGGFWERP
jgi:hypothetical protein